MATRDDILQGLIKAQKASTYTPKTADQIRAQAEGEYESYYSQRRLAAEQSQQAKDLALQQQLEGLGRTYQRQMEQSQRQYNQMYSQAERQQLSRGMQRSSYAAQVLANIGMRGAEAQRDIEEQQGAAEGNIEAQRAQLAQQLADQLAGYDADKAADVLNRIRQLEDQEYERGMAAKNTQNSLSAQIYQFLYQQERDKVADAQWEKQFNESRKKSGGGSSKKKAAAPGTPAAIQITDDAFNNAMGTTPTNNLNKEVADSDKLIGTNVVKKKAPYSSGAVPNIRPSTIAYQSTK